jgi:hypothetical protein
VYDWGHVKTAINTAVHVYIYTMHYKCTIGGVDVQKYAVGTFDINS